MGHNNANSSVSLQRFRGRPKAAPNTSPVGKYYFLHESRSSANVITDKMGTELKPDSRGASYLQCYEGHATKVVLRRVSPV
jgi:hypothetical protein